LQRFTARFAKSWDHTYNKLFNGQKSGKILVDFLVALLVKFTEISEPDLIDIASKASGNPIIAIFNKSKCKDTEWPFWFIWISYGRYACLGANCNDFNGILHTYVHCAVTPPGGSAPRTNEERRAQQKQASRVQQQQLNEIKHGKIAKSKSNETTDGRAAALDKMALATVHKNGSFRMRNRARRAPKQHSTSLRRLPSRELHLLCRTFAMRDAPNPQISMGHL
jgi:hypothetical protein